MSERHESFASEAQAWADDTSAWLKRQGCLFWVVIGIGVLWLASEFAPHGQDAVNAKLADGTGIVAVTAADLANAYVVNEVSAQNRYGSSVLDVTGKVARIELDLTNNPMVSFVGQGFATGPTAHFEKAVASALGALSPGQVITVRCASVMEVMGFAQLNECVVQSVP